MAKFKPGDRVYCIIDGRDEVDGRTNSFLAKRLGEAFLVDSVSPGWAHISDGRGGWGECNDARLALCSERNKGDD